MNPGPLIQLLRHRRFFILLASDALSNLGDWLTVVALMILCYEKTGSAMGVSALLVLRAIPVVGFGWVAGAVVDRFDRKRIMILANILRGSAVLLLVFHHETAWCYAVSFFVSAAGSFFHPALDAALPSLVEEAHIVRANSLLTMEKMAAMIAGPALAALCIRSIGFSATFFIDAASFFVFAAALAAVAFPAASVAQSAAPNRLLGDLKEGLGFVRANASVKAVLAGSAVGFCAMGALGTLELVFCSQILAVNPSAYGIVVAIAGAGAVFGSVLAAGIWHKNYRTLFAAGLALFGLGIVFFGLQNALIATIPFLLMEGVGESFFTIGGKSILQHSSSDTVIGKVMSFREMAQKTGMTLGMLLAGVLATWFDVRWVLIGFGLVALIPTVPILRKFPVRMASSMV